MDKTLRHLRGACFLEISGVSMELILNRLSKEKIGFWNTEKLDDFTWKTWVLTKDLEKTKQIIDKSQSTSQVLNRTGVFWYFRGLKSRKLFAFLLILSIIAVYFMSEVVIFVKVEGNQTVSSQRILEEISNLGITIGTPTATIQPQQLKYQMLTKIPQLEWLTVTTNGSVATISVRERTNPLPFADRKTVTNIIADQSALITEVSVLSGDTRCKVGDIVTKGQVLISGYGDLETTVHATASLGEVYGRTWRGETVVFPTIFQEKSNFLDNNVRHAIIFGEKRINLYKNSGIVTVKCDKMVVIKPLTLPGGYTFPIAWVTETIRPYETQPMTVDELVAADILTQSAEEMIKSQMIAGVMEGQTTKITQQDGLYILDGIYQCHEMIGRVVPALQFKDG